MHPSMRPLPSRSRGIVSKRDFMIQTVKGSVERRVGDGQPGQRVLQAKGPQHEKRTELTRAGHAPATVIYYANCMGLKIALATATRTVHWKCAQKREGPLAPALVS